MLWRSRYRITWEIAWLYFGVQGRRIWTLNSQWSVHHLRSGSNLHYYFGNATVLRISLYKIGLIPSAPYSRKLLRIVFEAVSLEYKIGSSLWVTTTWYEVIVNVCNQSHYTITLKVSSISSIRWKGRYDRKIWPQWLTELEKSKRVTKLLPTLWRVLVFTRNIVIVHAEHMITN